MARSRAINFLYICILIGCIIFWVWQFRHFFYEKYIKYALRNERIVLTLTTTPYRINKIQKQIQSLLEQSAKIDKIYLSIPYIFERDSVAYIIPEWLIENDKITILRTDDYGPATKLLGLLQRVKLPRDTIVISVDDDIVYAKNIMLHLAYNSMLHPNMAVGVSGADIYNNDEPIARHDRKLGIKTRYGYDGKVDILQGYAGIAYRYSFFENDIFQISGFPLYCRMSDDIYFSIYLNSKNIDRYAISNPFISTASVVGDTDFANGLDALHLQLPTMADRYRLCVEFLNSKLTTNE